MNSNMSSVAMNRNWRIGVLVSVVALLLCLTAAFVGWAKSPLPIEDRLKDMGGDVHSLGLGDGYSTVLHYPERIFGPLRRFHEIAYVEIQSEEFNDIMLEDVCAIETLRSLTINSSAITDEGLQAVARCRKLNSLQLAAPISDKGLSIVSELPSLERMTVVSDRVTGKFIGHFPNGTPLEHLAVSGEQVNDDACRNAVKCIWLASIDVSGSQVTDSGLMKLVALENLANVVVKDTNVTSAGVNAFRQAAPRVNVEE